MHATVELVDRIYGDDVDFSFKIVNCGYCDLGEFFEAAIVQFERRMCEILLLKGAVKIQVGLDLTIEEQFDFAGEEEEDREPLTYPAFYNSDVTTLYRSDNIGQFFRGCVVERFTREIVEFFAEFPDTEVDEIYELVIDLCDPHDELD